MWNDYYNVLQLLKDSVQIDYYKLICMFYDKQTFLDAALQFTKLLLNLKMKVCSFIMQSIFTLMKSFKGQYHVRERSFIYDITKQINYEKCVICH